MKFLTIIFLSFLLLSNLASAEEANPKSAFLNYKDITDLALVIPTVVSLPLEDDIFENTSFLVEEIGTGNYIGHVLDDKRINKKIEFSVLTSPQKNASYNLVDGDRNTKVNFGVDDATDSNEVMIELFSQGGVPVTATRLNLMLAEYADAPLSVSIKAKTLAGYETIVAKKPIRNGVLTFPETTASQWLITFTHNEPLVISELTIGPDIPLTETNRELRFLAQPDESYRIYFNSDRTVSVSATETGNIKYAPNVVVLKSAPTMTNRQYIPADIDGDDITDTLDNCPRIANQDQTDIDENGIGDACEDFDKDGVSNLVDNCRDLPNRNQSDEDGDGVGDVCDDEESRFTEQNPLIPWIGMGIALLVIVGLFVLVLTSKKEDDLVTEGESPNPPAPTA